MRLQVGLQSLGVIAHPVDFEEGLFVFGSKLLMLLLELRQTIDAGLVSRELGAEFVPFGKETITDLEGFVVLPHHLAARGIRFMRGERTAKCLKLSLKS